MFIDILSTVWYNIITVKERLKKKFLKLLEEMKNGKNNGRNFKETQNVD